MFRKSSFILMICAMIIVGMGLMPAQAAKKADAEKAVTALVDINSASEKELEGLKGIGAVTAKKIVANRPYKTVDELSKAGLSAKTIEAVKPFVTVGKGQAAPVTAAVDKTKAAVDKTKTAAADKTKTALAEKKTEVQKGVAAGLIDINSASEKELESLKGVGSVSAKKIVANRPYKTVDELSKAGLSAKTVEAVKPFVTVGKPQTAPVTAAATKAATTAATPVTKAAADATKAAGDVKATAKSTAAAKLAPGTKININTADQATLEKLPEIGPVKAKAIIDGRPYKSVEDIMKVKGIKGKTFDTIKDFIVVK